MKKYIRGKQYSNYGNLLKHSQKRSEKYSGKYIAVVGTELVAIGNNEIEVFKKAKEKYPDREVSITYIPREEEIVTLL